MTGKPIMETAYKGIYLDLDGVAYSSRAPRGNPYGRNPTPLRLYKSRGKLAIDAGGTQKNIDTLMLETYVGKRPSPRHFPRHRDGDNSNNQLINLEWSLRETNTSSPIYSNWEKMRRRCLNPNHDSYHHYGGRGITICKVWEDFKKFEQDMLPTYFNGATLDRIDNNGPYSPDNCRWATQEQQANNTRNNRFVEYRNKKYTLAQLPRVAESRGVPKSAFLSRVYKNWDIEAAVEKPLRGEK